MNKTKFPKQKGGGKIMEKDDVILIAVIAVVLSGIIGYFIGGRNQNQNQSSVSSPFSNNRFGRFGNSQSSNSQNSTQSHNANSMAGPRQVMGEILSQDDKSITVKVSDGGSKIIFINDMTKISKSTTATKADLKIGEKITIFGPENSDGSVTADNIQLNSQVKTPQQ